MKIWKRISVIVVVLFLMLLPMQVYAEQNSVHDQLRQELRTALWNHEPELNVEKYHMSPEEITAVYRQLVTEEPGYWHVAKACGYISNGSIALSLQFFYFMDAQQAQGIRAVVQNVIDKYIHSGMSDVHKALALHDYLVMNCAYDTNFLNYEPYDALVLGSSVCQGYAEAYEILLDAVGIESEVVDSDAMNHAWNLVKIDGQWYHVDVTWDDPLHAFTGQDTPGYVRHSHFLCSDSEIQSLDHYGWETDIACTSTAYDGEMFWDESTSAIWFLSDKEVLMRRDTISSMEVFTKNLQTGTENMLYANMNKYYEYDGYWLYTNNLGLSYDQGAVYFGDLTKIYKLSDLAGTPEVVCTREDLAEGQYIYSSSVDGIVLRAVVVNRDTQTAQIVTKLLDEAHVHTWLDGVVTVEPTEYSQGEICYICSGCGEVYRKILEKTEHTHSYSQTTIAPTCTDWGYTHFVCNCGDNYIENYIVPLGHAEIVAKGVSPTCTQAGLTAGTYCGRCFSWLVAQDAIPALGHSWKSATCTTPKTCTTCGAKEGSALGHNWQNATCDKPMICSHCKASSGRPAGHTYSNKVDGTCNGCGIHRETTENRTVMHMFRMYDPNSGEHFYTGSEVERENLVAAGWHYEGVGFTFSRTTGAPVYRLYDRNNTFEHLYTMDEAEKNKLVAQGWELEGIAFNSAYDTEVPQYRLHNPNETRGAYHFTASTEERDALIAAGWEYQGIGFYSSWK